MNDSLASRLAELDRWAALSSAERTQLLTWAGSLRDSTAQERGQVVAWWLGAVSRAGVAVPSPADREWQALEARTFSALAEGVLREGSLPPAADEPAEDLTAWLELYRGLGPQDRARQHLLRGLLMGPTGATLVRAIDLLAEDPPPLADDAVHACWPLFRRTDLAVEELFPRLFAALAQPSMAAIVLDLANYFTLSGRAAVHPAQERVEPLSRLLRGLVERLRRSEEDPRGVADTAEGLREQINDTVALFTSLSHALGLVGDRRAVPALTQGLDVGHRRVQLEAAAALGRLGEVAGLEHLAALAREPAARSRALAYLAELDALDRVAAELLTPLARAEGDLAHWLADPQHLGAAPSRIWLLEERPLAWPGFDEPQNCFLFGFEYAFARGALAGVGLAGPLTLGLPGAWDDLTPDDLFGYFAGWQTEHPEIRHWTADELGPRWTAHEARLAARLAGQETNYAGVRLELVGQFFDQLVWVAAAEREAEPGILVVDEHATYWWASRAESRRLGPLEAYWIYQGRQILSTFNRPPSS